MRTRIEHTMAMVWRTANPNYIIIVKNKAGEDMDFSQFKIAPAEEQKPKREKKPVRYILTITPYVGTLLLVRLNDLFESTEPVRVETTEAKKEYWIKRLKREYRGLRYDA